MGALMAVYSEGNESMGCCSFEVFAVTLKKLEVTFRKMSNSLKYNKIC